MFLLKGNNWKIWIVPVLRSLGMCRTGKCLNPEHNIPLIADEKRTKEKNAGGDSLIEKNDDTASDDAVYCEGECKAWLHRKYVCSYVKLFYDKHMIRILLPKLCISYTLSRNIWSYVHSYQY